MQFKRQLPGGPSLRRFATGRAEQTIAPTRLVANTSATRAGLSTALGQRLGSHLEVVHRPAADDRLGRRDLRIRTSPKRDVLSRSILAGRFRAVMKTVGGFAARVEAAFEGFLLAAMSWTVAQALAGCAEYCQAMYPTFVEPDKAFDRHDAADGPQPDRSVGNPFGDQQTGTHGTLTQSHQSRLRATFIVYADAVPLEAASPEAVFREALARSQAKRSEAKRSEAKTSSKRTALRRWRAAITSPVAEFWWRLRHERESKRAIMELRALGDRAREDVEFSRRQTEYTEYIASLREPALRKPAAGDPCK
jgi:hypothetical protein